MKEIIAKKYELDFSTIQQELFEVKENNQQLTYQNKELEKDLNQANKKKSKLRQKLIEIKKSHKKQEQELTTTQEKLTQARNYY